MKAILINPKLQTINHVDYNGDYKQIYKFLEFLKDLAPRNGGVHSLAPLTNTLVKCFQSQTFLGLGSFDGRF